MDTAFAINPSIVDRLPYDAERDFTFVAIIATSPSLLVTHPGLKVRTIQELIAAAKNRPGKITYASAGVGSSSHLTGAMLNAAAKINLLHRNSCRTKRRAPSSSGRSASGGRR